MVDVSDCDPDSIEIWESDERNDSDSGRTRCLRSGWVGPEETDTGVNGIFQRLTAAELKGRVYGGRCLYAYDIFVLEFVFVRTFWLECTAYAHAILAHVFTHSPLISSTAVLAVWSPPFGRTIPSRMIPWYGMVVA